MKYTRDDVIKSTLDCRLEYARECKCVAGNDVDRLLGLANDSLDYFDKVLVDIVSDSKTPFIVRDCIGVHHSSFIILKGEWEKAKKIVPFDFSLKEDRDALMGKRIISTSGDLIVTAFAFWSDWGWLLQVDSEFGYDSDFVLGEFVFADTGKPVGKEVFE